MTQTLRILLSGLIDYAGLFPPASLSMQQAVERYARHRQGDFAWALGTFICPASRLTEFSEAAAVYLPGTFATSGYREAARGEPWRISALADLDIHATIKAIDDFNERHSAEDRGLAAIDCLEIKASSAGDIDAALDALPEDLFPYFEIPIDGDPRGMVAALAGESAAAKVRTGGVTPHAIPPAERVAAFLEACAQASVPFKATAGLHHPVRAEYPLSYAPDAPRGLMHGFLNVFLGAAMIRAMLVDRKGLEQVLNERDAAAFEFTDSGVTWRKTAIDSATLAQVRESFALSYGSCSFEEPIDDLKALGLL